MIEVLHHIFGNTLTRVVFFPTLATLPLLLLRRSTSRTIKRYTLSVALMELGLIVSLISGRLVEASFQPLLELGSNGRLIPWIEPYGITYSLVLDGISDPRNLGACLRSAKAAGVQAVLLPKRRSAPLNAAALKTAAGAAESLFIVEVSNLARRLDWLQQQGVWLIGAAGEGTQSWTSVDMTPDIAVIVGGEEKGLRVLTRKHCDQLIHIPMAGGVESLNVSVATGIILFEAVRQRTLASG